MATGVMAAVAPRAGLSMAAGHVPEGSSQPGQANRDNGPAIR